MTILSIFRTKDQYLIRLEPPGADLAAIPVYTLSRDLERDLAEDIERAARLLQYLYARRRALDVPPAPSPDSDPLRRLGWRMFRALPPPVRDGLRRLEAHSDDSGSTHSEALVISTNDGRLPWELLHDGERFLALTLPMGRRLITSAPIRRRELRKREGVWRALFIANPTGDLSDTVKEAEELADLIEKRLGGQPARIICHGRATRKAVLEALSGGEYDLVHYAGHAFFDPRDPGASGLVLAGEETLTAREIQAALSGRPIVFLNACESARGGAESAEVAPFDVSGAALRAGSLAYAGLTARGLASHIIAGGARAFVGTLWGVHDDRSRAFARIFYREALGWIGQVGGETIGEALRRARERLWMEAPDDPTWASFALYGDPGLYLVEGAAVGTRTALRPVSVLSGRIEGLSERPAYAQLGQYLEHLRDEIVTHQGEIVSLVHDSVTATFGAATALENHVELAVRAALSMRRVTAQFGIRLAMEAGEVAVRYTGGTADNHITALGPVFERARSLRDRASAGQILIGERAQKEASAIFELAPCPAVRQAHHENGAAAAGYEVLGVKSKRERILAPHFASSGAGERASFVGREEPLSILNACCERSCRDRVQVVGIAGEAGVGKSRLLYEFAQRRKRSGDGAKWLLGFGESHRQDVSYYWLAQILRDLFEIELSDAPQSVTRKLRSKFEELGLQGQDLAEPLSCFGEILGVGAGLVHALGQNVGAPLRGRPTAIPEVRRAHLVYYLQGLLAHQADKGPLVIVAEDAHWIDEASLEVIGQCMAEISAAESSKELGHAPILLLALYRPGRVFGWEGKPYYRLLSLTNLQEEQSERLLRDLLGEAEVSREARLEFQLRDILEKTEGNPFFLEEVVASVKEHSDSLSQLDQVEIPSSIRGVLLSRNERLGVEERAVLMAASTIGRRFPYHMLAEVIGLEVKGRERLEARLIELKRRGLLIQDRDRSLPLSPRRRQRYAFRHSLIQEVAYASLPAGERRRYHRRAGEFIKRNRGLEALAGIEDVPELLAYHYYRSLGTFDPAAPRGVSMRIGDDVTQEELIETIGYLLEAGERARQRYANREAIRFYRQALSLTKELPSDQAQGMGWEVECHEGLGDAHHLLGEFDLALEHLGRAFSLLSEGDSAVVRKAHHKADRRRAAGIAGRIGRIYERKGGRDNLLKALEWRDRGLALLPEGPVLSEAEGATAEAALLHALGGIVSFRQADFGAAKRRLEHALALGREAGAEAELRLVHSMLGMTLHAQGRLEQAMEHCEISIELDQARSDWVALAKDYSNRGAYAFEMDDWRMARDSYLQALELLERVGDRYQLAITSCNLADLYCHLGELEEGLAYAKRGLELFSALESYQGMIFAHAVFATLHWRRDELEAAQKHLSRAREIEQAHDVDMFRPTVGRWLAQVYLSAGEIERAEAEVQSLLTLETDLLADEAEPIQCLRGQILAARGEWAKASQVLCAAIARLEQKQMRYQTGRALLALAEVLMQIEGRATEARSHAKRAHEIFTDLGAAMDASAIQRIENDEWRMTGETL